MASPCAHPGRVATAVSVAAGCGVVVPWPFRRVSWGYEDAAAPALLPIGEASSAVLMSEPSDGLCRPSQRLGLWADRVRPRLIRCSRDRSASPSAAQTESAPAPSRAKSASRSAKSLVVADGMEVTGRLRR